MVENTRNSSSAGDKNLSWHLDHGTSIMFNVAAIMCVYFLGVLLSVVGNTLICWIVKRNSSMHTSINYLLVNLAVADLLVTLFSLPIILTDAELTDINRGNLLCKVQKASFRVFHRSSIFTLIAIAHNRYRAICKPLMNMSQEYRIKCTVSLIWFLSFASTTPMFVYCGAKVYQNNRTACACLDMFPTRAGVLVYTIYVTMVDYAATGMVIALFYVAIIFKLRRHPPGQSRACPAYQARRGVIKMLLISFIFFIVSWTPVYVIYMLEAFNVDLQNISKFVYYPALLLGFGNAAFNPIIYCLFSKNFREGFKATLCCRRPLLRDLTQTRMTTMPMGSQNSRILPEGETANDNQSFGSSCCSRWTFNLNTSKQINARVRRPTSEEVKEWSNNFDALLNHEYGVLIFFDFLKSQHCQENLNFWIAVERFKLKSEEAMEGEAKLIYENYISILSPTEISIDSKTRNSIEMNMQHLSSDTFQLAQDQIYTLMKRDCLPRFLKSKQYKQLR